MVKCKRQHFQLKDIKGILKLAKYQMEYCIDSNGWHLDKVIQINN